MSSGPHPRACPVPACLRVVGAGPSPRGTGGRTPGDSGAAAGGRRHLDGAGADPAGHRASGARRGGPGGGRLHGRRARCGTPPARSTTRRTWWRAGGLPRSGRATFPSALRLLDEAEERYAKLGTPTFMLYIRRCEVLMAAGLAPEALAEADTAIGAARRHRRAVHPQGGAAAGGRAGGPARGRRAHGDRASGAGGTAVRRAAAHLVGDACPTGADRGAGGRRARFGTAGRGRGGGRRTGSPRSARRPPRRLRCWRAGSRWVWAGRRTRNGIWRWPPAAGTAGRRWRG